MLADKCPSVSLPSRHLSGVDEGPGKCHSEGHVVRTASPVEASWRTPTDRLVASTAVKVTGVACPRDCEGQTSRGQGLNKSALSCLCNKMQKICSQNLSALHPFVLTAACHWWFKSCLFTWWSINAIHSILLLCCIVFYTILFILLYSSILLSSILLYWILLYSIKFWCILRHSIYILLYSIPFYYMLLYSIAF